MKEYKIEDFMNRITLFQPSSLSKDGSRLAYISNVTGAPQVWVGELSSKVPKMLFPKPLTTDKNKAPNVFSDSLQFIDEERLIVIKDTHGDEQTFIEIHHLKTGDVEGVPRGDGKDSLGFMSKDKKTLYFNSSRDDNSSLGLYSYDLKTKKINFYYREKGISSMWGNPNEYKGNLIVAQTRSNTASVLKMIHLKTKKVTDVFVEPNTLIYPLEVMPKDKLLVMTNYRRQFISLGVLDLKTKEIKYVQKDQWDLESFDISSDKKTLYFSKNVAGKSVLEIYTYPGLKKVPAKFKTTGIITNIHSHGKSDSIVLGFMSPTEPKNYYRYSVKTKKIERLTDTWTSVIPEKELCQPKEIKFSSEGKTIYSWLFLPKETKQNKKTPVIIWPHGGPQAQEKAQFRPIFQYFVSKGFAIWAPNHSGSTGFGTDFVKSIEGQWGTADFPDMLNGIDWLKKSGWIDPKNISIMGGSYGGYMTLRCITKIPNTFKVAVDIFGPANLFTFIDSVPPDWKPFMDEMVGNAQRDHEKLTEQSPIFALDKIDCPLIVVQGGRDPRVVQSESDQVVEKLRSMKKTVEYLVFEDEGHGFLKTENELKAYEAIAEFVKKYT